MVGPRRLCQWVAGAVVALGLVGAAPAGDAPRKNILYMIADDMRPEWDSYCPTCGLHTPNLNQLVAEGLLFTRAYCQQAICGPSRNSFMSGRRIGTTLAWNFKESFRTSILPSGSSGGGATWKSVPQHFKESGWLTAGGGKTYHEGLPANFDSPWSWTEPTVGTNKPFSYLPPHYPASSGGSTYQVCCQQPFDPEKGCVHIADAGGGYCKVDNENDIFDYVLANHTISTMELAHATGKPWMIYAGFKKPHAPWGSPTRMYDLYEPLETKVRLPKNQFRPKRSPNVSSIGDFFLRLDNGTFDDIYLWGPDQAAPDYVVLRNRQAYYAAVSHVDEQVGRVMGALRRLGLRNDTVVLMHSDHGYQLGEHNEWEKKTNYELAARVPLVISCPWLPASVGRRTHVLSELVDLFPTLNSLMGLPALPAFDGQGTDLSPIFSAPELGAGFKNASFTVYPVCTPVGSASRGYPSGTHYPHNPTCSKLSQTNMSSCNTHGCIAYGYNSFRKMGFSMRTDSWRYTAWVPWDGEQLLGNWSASPIEWPNDAEDKYNRELYDHRTDDGSDFGAFENENLADLPEYQGIVRELHEQLRVHHNSYGCATSKEKLCCTTAACAAARLNGLPGCVHTGSSELCQCGTKQQQVSFGAHHDAGIIVANNTVAIWTKVTAACDSVALMTPFVSTSNTMMSSSFWVSVAATAGQFFDIGLCSPTIATDGTVWAAHQEGKAFLYRGGSGNFADSFVTAPPPCGKGTACGQGVHFGKALHAGSNLTVIKRSPTQIEFLIDGKSQGTAVTTKPMPADVVGCVSSCDQVAGMMTASLASCAA